MLNPGFKSAFNAKLVETSVAVALVFLSLGLFAASVLATVAFLDRVCRTW